MPYYFSNIQTNSNPWKYKIFVLIEGLHQDLKTGVQNCKFINLQIPIYSDNKDKHVGLFTY